MNLHEENSVVTSSEASSHRDSSNFWKELVKLVLLAVVIVVPFRLYIAQPFIVDGLSMYPTFDDKEYLIIDELTYHFDSPVRGSVLIFKYPKDTSKYFIKRVIGLPGETISLTNGSVTITNKANPEGFTLEEPYIELTKSETADFVLDEDEYFVMGDNRAQSADSRMWGAVPTEDIVGRPILRFLPPTFFPGQVTYATEQINNNP